MYVAICWSTFLLRVKESQINSHLLWFRVTSLNDWLKNFALLSCPIGHQHSRDSSMLVFPHFAASLCICCRRVLCGSLDCPCPLSLARAVLKSARKANLDWTLVQWFSMECYKTKPNENLTETQITGAKRGKSHVSNWCLDWLCARILNQSQPQNQRNPGLPWNIVTLYVSASFRPFTFALSESPYIH